MSQEWTRRAAIWGGTALLALSAGLLAGAGASGALAELARFPDATEHLHDHDHSGGGSTPLTDAGRRVAAGLSCPCGCPDLLLACDCGRPGGAAEVKRTIGELLANGRSESEARIELVNRFGAKIQRAAR